MSGEPLSRRSVQAFCNYYGLTRNQYLNARAKAKIAPKAHDAMLSVKSQEALLRHIGAKKREDQVVRKIRQRPTVTKRFVPPPPPEPESESSIDYEAKIHQVAESLDKWRTVLVELARGHNAADDPGPCKRCRKEVPCPTRQTLSGLENELVERIAAADYEVPLDRQLSQMYVARNRWMSGLTKLTIDHMLADEGGRCLECDVPGPCDIKNTVMRINKGIAHRIEKFATMDDGELEVALGNRRRFDDYADAAWDAM
ncbi:hypothetical protein KIH27_03395 [Mycobacterium sp. M1]|uniref:Terminase small subunit n=1 Tax=Mycolicibacter acidiphilus TaxID=2835306 RepID=A0ABS5RGB8_9MYCO|nr:hypothetical protein [Mycolicibacter acidiphilus]MBS9532628.1 hypothetical protein [Mycolicibacter acidiphilus]